jgi:CobQ-like glutamine amidotransferase family enzyme
VGLLDREKTGCGRGSGIGCMYRNTGYENEEGKTEHSPVPCPLPEVIHGNTRNTWSVRDRCAGHMIGYITGIYQ